MHWIVEFNKFNEARYDEVISTLHSGRITHSVIKTIPFSDTIEPNLFISGPVAVIGSYTLVRIAAAREWGPGVFMSPQIDLLYYGAEAVLRPHLLNSDGEPRLFGDVKLTAPMFVRPTGDGKQFIGKVYAPDEFEAWQELIRRGEQESGMEITSNSPVWVATPKEIIAEYRFFVVDGEIVASSMYKLNGVKREDDWVPRQATEFAQRMVALWQPDRAFVIDIAEGPNTSQFKIVEYNCINAAGWYKANVSKIIQAIDGMRDKWDE